MVHLALIAVGVVPALSLLFIVFNSLFLIEGNVS